MTEETKKTENVKDNNLPISARFTNGIIREFTNTAGNLPDKFDKRRQRLSQHLFIKMDASLQALEKKRREGNSVQQKKPPITWANLNMQKLAIDAMNRIELGLDALLDNHIWVIPYLDARTKLYNVDLRIGYIGKDYYKRKLAIEQPVDVIYELVHEADNFVVHKKDVNHSIETYEFEITNPFDRGEVVGGFGYIIFKDPTKNKLVPVSEASFVKSKERAPSDKFWKPYPEEMRYGKLVHKTMGKLQVDPDKVNQSYAATRCN
jgi:recombination protein RecT